MPMRSPRRRRCPAAILNRHGSLGPAADLRSRGEIVLEALDHADAVAAAAALSHLDPAAYRTFNLIVADNRDGFWLRHDGTGRIAAHPLAEGLSLIAAGDVNETARRRQHAARRPGGGGLAVPHHARICHGVERPHSAACGALA